MLAERVARGGSYFVGGRLVGDGGGGAAGEGDGAQRDCANDDFAGGGDLCAGIAVPRTGVFAGVSQFAVDRFVARGCAEYFGNVDDVDGSAVLGNRCGNIGEIAEEVDCRRPGGGGLGCGDDTLALDGTSPAVLAVAAGVLHQRRARLWAAAAVVVSAFSVVGVCVFGAGAGLPVCF